MKKAVYPHPFRQRVDPKEAVMKLREHFFYEAQLAPTHPDEDYPDGFSKITVMQKWLFWDQERNAPELKTIRYRQMLVQGMVLLHY